MRAETFYTARWQKNRRAPAAAPSSIHAAAAAMINIFVRGSLSLGAMLYINAPAVHELAEKSGR